MKEIRRGRIPAALLLTLVVAWASTTVAADDTARFLKACGTPDRDVAVFDTFMAPQRTLYYDRAGFAIVFDLPKQPQGPLPRSDGKWFWPTVKPPHLWKYDWVRSTRGDGCVPSDFFLVPCCHMSVPDKYHALCPLSGIRPLPCSDGSPPYGSPRDIKLP